jgi:predicted O-methyltransferase YrrM
MSVWNRNLIFLFDIFSIKMKNFSQAPTPLFSFKQKLQLFSIGIYNWNIPTYTTSDELLTIYNLAKSLSKKSVLLEVGSYLGASSLMIAKGIKKSSKLICVDTWQNDAMSEGKWDSYKIFLSNIRPVKDRIETVQSTSIEASNKINEHLDMIFIDGDHSYEAVKNDVSNWFPKLKSGGIIVMHDIGWATGVQKVVEEDVKPFLREHDNLPNIFWGWKR